MSLVYPSDLTKDLRRYLDYAVREAESHARAHWVEYVSRYDRILDVQYPSRIEHRDHLAAKRLTREFVEDVLFGRTNVAIGFWEAGEDGGHDSADIQRWAKQLLPEVTRYAYTIEFTPLLKVTDIEATVSNEVQRILSSQRWQKYCKSAAALEELTRTYPTPLARNIDKLRKECGWSYDDLSKASDVDKTTILATVNKGTKPRPSTLERYAQTFSDKLGHPITVAELEA